MSDSGEIRAADYCFIFELHNGLIHRVREDMDTRRAEELFTVSVPS
ncbi:hypothetical protein [Nocardia sp.]|nr:hypothetical protein [Nocardia sp.]